MKFKSKNIFEINRVEANSVQKLDADQQSKFYLKFAIKEKTKGSLIEAHQAFVKFTESKSGREIVFLAQSTKGQYSAEVVSRKSSDSLQF